mgnify:CR=1 FL=1
MTAINARTAESLATWHPWLWTWGPRIGPRGAEATEVAQALEAIGWDRRRIGAVVDEAGGVALRLESPTPDALHDLIAPGRLELLHDQRLTVLKGSDTTPTPMVWLLAPSLTTLRHALEQALQATPHADWAAAALVALADSQRSSDPFDIPNRAGARGVFRVTPGVPAILGIVNVTPDSFSDGGYFLNPQQAIDHALRLRDEGATLLDVGGESTRPGALPVSVDEECRRVLPVIEQLAARTDVPISVDTSKPLVATRALQAGATWINDVTGFRDPKMIEAAAGARVPVFAMHMQGDPRTMQTAPSYAHVVLDVARELRQRAAALVAAGVPREAIVFDPGFGFGKSLAHNMALLQHTPALARLGHPLLTGLSRKSSLGSLSGEAVAAKRIPESIAAHALAAWLGASFVRVHDVDETRRALAIVAGVRTTLLKADR